MTSTTRMDELIGHDAIIARLREQLRALSLPSSLFFCGPASIGKYQLALSVGLALLRDEGCPVGSLRDTNQQEGHADLYKVDLEVGTEQIKIDQVRLVQQFLSTTPFQADKKVVIIRHAERLTIEAQQALLKTVEEPPAFATLILLSDSEEALLETMRSRLTRLSFSPLTKVQVAHYLENLELKPALIDMLWERFGGRIGALMTFLSEHSPEDIRTEHSGWEQLLSASPAERLRWSAEQNFDNLPLSLAKLAELQSVWRAMGTQHRLDAEAQAIGQRLILGARAAAKLGLNYQLLMDNVLANLPMLKG